MEQRIIAVIQELCPVDTRITEEMLLKEDLGFDSLKLVQLLVLIEEKMGFEFEESDLDPSSLVSIGDYNRLVAKYL